MERKQRGTLARAARREWPVLQLVMVFAAPAAILTQPAAAQTLPDFRVLIRGEFETLDEARSIPLTGWQAFVDRGDEVSWQDCEVVDTDLEIVLSDSSVAPFRIGLAGGRYGTAFRGASLPTGKFACAMQIEDAPGVEPNQRPESRFWTYAFGTDTLGVYARTKDGVAQIVYRENDREQILFETTERCGFGVWMLGDFDHDGRADMLLAVGTGNDQPYEAHYILYGSRSADPDTLLKELGRWSEAVVVDLG